MRYVSTLVVGIVLLFGASEVRAAEVVDHSTWTELLEEYVDSRGAVDYEAWSGDEQDLERLDAYLEKIGGADPEGHGSDARLAFYLNAYNAHVIDAILENWPTESPQSIDGFFDRREHEVAGEKMTLDQLEHELIRPKFGEPRIHFVIVCAAKSCPRLRRKALTGATLDSTLQAAAEEFVSEATELKEGAVVTSSLFDWFAEDFEKSAGSVREYLADYTSGEVEEALQKEDVEIEFHDYDWSVNQQ